VFTPGGPTFIELMRQALSSTDRGYDLLAPTFDLTPFRTPDALLDAARPRLDLCCGTGAGVRMLRPLCRDLVVGIDRSAGMLAQAAEANHPPGAQVQWVRGDALEPPFAAGFDLVSCFGAFGHILETDEPRLVENVRALLRPGGRFVFFTSPSPGAFNPGRWIAKGFNAAMRVRNALIQPPFIMYYLTFMLPRAKALLQSAGFSIETHSGLGPKPYDRLVLVVATRS
jgi:SAM-dependent methyltransferase